MGVLSCGRCSPRVTPNCDPFDLASYKMTQTVVSALPWTPALKGCALIPRLDRAPAAVYHSDAGVSCWPGLKPGIRRSFGITIPPGFAACATFNVCQLGAFSVTSKILGAATRT